MATAREINDAFEAERCRLGRPMTWEEIQALDRRLAACGLTETPTHVSIQAHGDPGCGVEAPAPFPNAGGLIPAGTAERIRREHRERRAYPDAVALERALVPPIDEADRRDAEACDTERRVDRRAAEMRRRLDGTDGSGALDADEANLLEELLTLLGHPSTLDDLGRPLATAAARAALPRGALLDLELALGAYLRSTGVSTPIVGVRTIETAARPDELALELKITCSTVNMKRAGGPNPLLRP